MGKTKNSKTTTLKFRKEAIDNLSSFEQFGQLIRIITPKSWVVLAAFWGVLITVIIWGIFGTIPTWIEGKGLLLAEKSGVYNAVAPEGAGKIVKILVKPGEEVRKDQVIAQLENLDLSKQVQETKRHLGVLRGKYLRLNATSEGEIAQRQQNLKQQSESLSTALQSQLEYLSFVEVLLKESKEALAKGLITNHKVENTYRDYQNTQREIGRLQEQLIQNKSQQADFTDKWQQRIRDFELKIQNAKHGLDKLQEKLKLSRAVRAPVAGIIMSLQKTLGDFVKGGDPVVNITSMHENLDAIVYIPPEEGKRVKADMEVLVSPSVIKQEEYGSIKGRINSISAFPVSKQSMMAILQNENLVDNLSKNTAPIAIRVLLNKDANTFSGFAWSSSNGPEQKIAPGTLITARITVRNQAPVSLIIPAFKKLLGV